MRWRLLAAALALATVPLGQEIAAVAELACLFAFVLGCLLLELRSRAPGHRAGTWAA